MSEFWTKVDKTLRYHYRQQTIAVRDVWWDVVHPQIQAPIFIVGCSRAGTTLIYKTLSESRELGSLQRETHNFWAGLHPLEERNWDSHAIPLAMAKEHDRDYVARYFYSWTGKRRFVDKNNQNGLCVPYLHALFPDSHFIYVKRSPGDNLNSLIEGWGKPEEFASWSRQLPETVAIDAGKYPLWCFFLSDGWRDYLQAAIEEVCAFQYDAINTAILDASEQVATDKWHEVFYEDIVSDPVVRFSEMFKACGLSFDTRLEQHCQDVLNIPYNAFSEIRVDKWKDGRNRERIERILPAIEKIANRMGYGI